MKAFTMQAITFIAVLSTSYTAFASGPICITEAQVYGHIACESNAAGCIAVEYKASTAFGEGGGFSKPVASTSEIQNKMAVVKQIFDDAKAKNNGALSFCLEKMYQKGELLGHNFTILDFLNAVEREDQLTKSE